MNVEPYFCFEHGIRYGSDGFMCPACEEEICREHDDTLEDAEEVGHRPVIVVYP